MYGGAGKHCGGVGRNVLRSMVFIMGTYIFFMWPK